MKNTNNADNITVQQNNEEWWKGTTLILGESTISGRKEKKMSRNRKIKVRYFPGPKIKDMYHNAIPLLEKKHKISSYILVHIMPLLNLVIIFWKIWLSWRISSWRSYPVVKKWHFRHLQSLLMKKARWETMKF